jgi:hypothetical protein
LIDARSKSKDAQFISELSEDHNHGFKKRKKKKRYDTNVILPESTPVTKHSSDNDDDCPTLNTSLGTIILRIVIK